MTELPRWTRKEDLFRDHTEYSDLLGVVAHHFRVTQDVENFLGPYNAKQRGKKVYVPPTKEELKASVKRGGMNEFSYYALLNSIVKFCENTKGMRALPGAHPSTIHSIQLPENAFEISESNGKTVLRIPGADPVYMKSRANAKFIIVRPKLSKLGTPSAKNWEVLLFANNQGYIPHWVDSHLNPRWSGII